jgi:hypothetical protein
MAISVSERHTACVFRMLEWNPYNWFIDPVSHHRSLKKGPALSYHTYIWSRYFGLSWEPYVVSSRNLHHCTTKKMLCAVRFFFHLTNTIQGKTALGGTISAYFLADLSHGHCCWCLQGFPGPLRYLLSVTTKQMSLDPCMYSYTLQQMYTYYCDVRTVDCVC